MNRIAPVNLTRVLSWLAGLVLVLVPFHAFLTVWLSSLLGHYTLLRLWKELLLLVIAAGALYILITNAGLRGRLWSLWLTKLIAAYLVLLLACAFVALARGAVDQKAMWYGLLVDTRFLVFFLSVLVIAAGNSWLEENWRKLLFIPAIIVAAFAILQYLVLPYDFLKHFGYSQNTIYPYETINHNLQRIRVMSTLRGANPLGAYLVIPLSVLAVSFFKDKRDRRDQIFLGAGLFMALAFSFSRSAWLGAVLALGLAVWLSLKSFNTRKIIGWWLIGGLILLCLLFLGLRNNLDFQNAVLHTDQNSTAKTSSNQGHLNAFKVSAKDIVHQPLGRGVGTAGPQSVYNNHPARIAENYFLQIGQEAGVVGMVLFIWICASASHLLYSMRKTPLALALLCALAGLTLVNLLSHAWSDDTLAYVWWGLAAIALAPILTDKRKQKNGDKIKQPT